MAFSFTFPYHFCFISAPQDDDVWFLCEEIAHTVSPSQSEKFSFICEMPNLRQTFYFLRFYRVGTTVYSLFAHKTLFRARNYKNIPLQIEKTLRSNLMPLVCHLAYQFQTCFQYNTLFCVCLELVKRNIHVPSSFRH